ncbi:MAG TPA: hypothetical protein VGS97_10250, partial [Actinocrinis sp.]
NRELHWGLWEQLIGAAYVWTALTALVLAALGYLPRLLPALPRESADAGRSVSATRLARIADLPPSAADAR